MRELAKEVALILMLLLLFVFYYFEQAHFVFVNGFLFVLFVKLLVVFFLKAENIAIYFYIHTIQPTLLVFKIAPFFVFCLTRSVKN